MTDVRPVDLHLIMSFFNRASWRQKVLSSLINYLLKGIHSPLRFQLPAQTVKCPRVGSECAQPGKDNLQKAPRPLLLPPFFGAWTLLDTETTLDSAVHFQTKQMANRKLFSYDEETETKYYRCMDRVAVNCFNQSM